VRRSAFFFAVALGGALWPGRVAAAPPEGADASGPPAPEPPVALAVVAGVVTAFVPMVIGALHVANAPTTTDGPRDVGYAVAGVGPALSPIIAHSVLGEWKRAAAFGAPTVASEIAVCAFVAIEPDGVFHGTVGSRTAFGLLFSADVFGAAIGIVDVMMARERWSPRGRRAARAPWRDVSFAPRIGRGQAGFVLGGTL
jgi:hypothetical protein